MVIDHHLVGDQHRPSDGKQMVVLVDHHDLVHGAQLRVGVDHETAERVLALLHEGNGVVLTSTRSLGEGNAFMSLLAPLVSW